jgi:hypothetical protein
VSEEFKLEAKVNVSLAHFSITKVGTSNLTLTHPNTNNEVYIWEERKVSSLFSFFITNEKRK